MRKFMYGCIAMALTLMLCNDRVLSSEKGNPLSILFPHQWVGNIDKTKFPEPSGIVFHPLRGTLFVVGDEGDIEEIQKDGTVVKQKRIRKADFEGITCDPSSGLLYLAVEGEEKIVEVNPEDFNVLREFSINRTFQGKTVLKKGGQGIESIAFVPDTNHPEGGTFYVGNQSFDLADQEDPSAIFEVEIPLKSSAGNNPSAKIIRSFTPGMIDLSGMHYDSHTGHLYIISDATNAFFEITKAGDLVRSYAFPGASQEGIALDDDGFVYIAQDSGGIVKIKWDAK